MYGYPKKAKCSYYSLQCNIFTSYITTTTRLHLGMYSLYTLRTQTLKRTDSNDKKILENFSSNLFFPKLVLTCGTNKTRSLHTSLLSLPAHRSMNTTANPALSFTTANVRKNYTTIDPPPTSSSKSGVAHQPECC